RCRDRLQSKRLNQKVSTSNPIAGRNLAVVYIRRQSQRDQQFATDRLEKRVGLHHSISYGSQRCNDSTYHALCWKNSQNPPSVAKVRIGDGITRLNVSAISDERAVLEDVAVRGQTQNGDPDDSRRSDIRVANVF